MKWMELTAPELESLDRAQTIVAQPIAAIEQHGPHLATGADAILVTEIAEAVERRLQDRLLLAPTFWWGASAHHLKFGGTLSCPLDLYIENLVHLATPALERGFLRFVFLNGHGGNTDPLRVALRRLQEAFPNRILAGAPYWSIASDAIQDTLEGPYRHVEHACEFETSMMMRLRPDLVREDRIPPPSDLGADVVEGLFVAKDMAQRTQEGVAGRPDLAEPGKGNVLFHRVVHRVCVAMEAVGREPIPA